jgi:hypothetical protein
MTARLQTSPTAPFGRYTGKFDKIESLALYLMFDREPLVCTLANVEADPQPFAAEQLTESTP